MSSRSDARVVRLLFVCSENYDRSLTAERIFASKPGFEVQSGGTRPWARQRVKSDQVDWADVVFVMRRGHRRYLERRFPGIGAKIVVLDIPDRYKFMDPRLVLLLNERVQQALRGRGASP